MWNGGVGGRVEECVLVSGEDRELGGEPDVYCLVWGLAGQEV